MSSSRTRGPVCGIDNCRSNRYEEGDDGYMYCQNGHRKGGLVAGQDEDTFDALGRRTTRKKGEETTERVSKYLGGRHATELYVHCLQLILRHQVWFLVHCQGAPEELETVVRDLWTLRISQLGDKILSNGPTMHSSQAFSGSDGEATGNESASRRARNAEKLQSPVILVDCLVLCYLGMQTLRLPVLPGDLYAWTTEDGMPFRNALRVVPPAMKERLPGHYRANLEPKALLSLDWFHRSLATMRSAFERDCGVLWPPLNVPLLLYRFLQEFALPLELYPATTRLGQLLEYDFAFHAPSKGHMPVRRQPEAQLIACFIVCIKLLYPFDGQPRHPTTDDEPAATTFSWSAWADIMHDAREASKHEGRPYDVEAMMHVKEDDVLKLQGSELDKYLDFYKDEFVADDSVDASRKDDFRSALFDMFPIDSTSRPLQEDRSSSQAKPPRPLEVVARVQSGTSMATVVAEGGENPGTRRPGDSYPSWKEESHLPEDAKVFLDVVARIVGLKLETLIQAVLAVEKGVEKWAVSSKRSARAA